MDREHPAASPRLESEDYYFEGELMVFTAAYHLKRGSCCKSGCRHCPYGFRGQAARNSECSCTEKKSEINNTESIS
ncbi:MAG: DUF5522 domain-containing protein [Terracidiphilus sp.]|jgi:hypothetical protein